MDVTNLQLVETRWFQSICFRINPQNSDYAEGGRGPGKTFNEESRF